MYINDIFFFVGEAFLSNADETALYFVKKTSLFLYLQKWFHDNYLVLNPGKCYYMTFGLNTTKNEFDLEDSKIIPSAEEHVLLGIIIDSCLTVYSHLK